MNKLVTTEIKWFFVVPLLLICTVPLQASARQNSMNTNVSVSENFNSNRYQTKDKRVDYWQTTVAPALTMFSTGEHDVVQVAYSPSFLYDHDRNTNDRSHNVTLSAERDLSSRWRVSFADSFSYSDADKVDLAPGGSLVENFRRADDYVKEEVVRILFKEDYDPGYDYEPELDYKYDEATGQEKGQVDALLFPVNPGRRRHYSNNISVDFVYDFAEESNLSFGYALSALYDKSAGMTERTDHSPYFSLQFSFNPQWSLALSYNYNWLDYKDDLEEQSSHGAGLQLDYGLTSHDQLYWSYDFSYTDYDADGTDFTTQSSGIGWSHDFSAQTHLTTYIGGNYESRDNLNDERGYTANASFSQAFQRGTFSVSAAGSFSEHKEDDWQDLRESMTLQTSLSYTVTPDVNINSSLSCGRNINWSGIGGNTKITKRTDYDYNAGLGLSYSFQRWYSVSINYGYHSFNTDVSDRDNYDDHQIFFGFTAQQELFRF